MVRWVLHIVWVSGDTSEQKGRAATVAEAYEEASDGMAAVANHNLIQSYTIIIGWFKS